MSTIAPTPKRWTRSLSGNQLEQMTSDRALKEDAQREIRRRAKRAGRRRA